MDPVTTAIVAAVSAGLDTAAKEAVKDAYQGLKQIIKKRLRSSDLPEAQGIFTYFSSHQCLTHNVVNCDGPHLF